MGIPVIVAPSEAEGTGLSTPPPFLYAHSNPCGTAQCAALARAGLVYAAGSEDMDTLTFGGSVLYRHLTFSEAKKAPIVEVNLEKALEGLEMDMGKVRFVFSYVFLFLLLLLFVP